MPPKILITAFDFWPRLGGVATCGFELASALARHSDVTVLAPKTSPLPSYEKSFPFKVVRVPLPGTALLAILPLAFWLVWHIRRIRPTHIVHLLWFPEAIAGLLAWPFIDRSSVHVSVFAHGVEVLESKVSLRKRLRSWMAGCKKRSFRQADSVFAVSQFTRGLVAEHCGRANATVVHNGVDTEKFRPRDKNHELKNIYGIGNEFVFLTITRLDDYKGVDNVIHAVAQLATDKSLPDFRYVVGGTGGDRQRLEKLIHENDVAEKVLLAGQIASDHLVDFYNLGDVHVLVSRDDFVTANVEGFGIAMLEAAACEIPSIAGDAGGIADAVAHGETGWLVPPEDVDAIANEMRRCLLDPDSVLTAGKRARERVEKNFQWQQMADDVLQVIQ